MLKTILFVFCSIFCISCFANMDVLEINDAALNEIIANGHACTDGVADDKIYINPDRIIPTREGLFLNVDGERFIPIPLLHSDSQGCYIKPIARIRVTKPCPHCGWEIVSGAFKCRNPDCPSNKPKQ